MQHDEGETSESVQVGILGPLQLRVGGRGVALDQAKPRALLALLVLAPNTVVGVSRLIDNLWERDRPRTAANTLQTYVHKLRSVLPRNSLVTRRGGYELVIDADAVDASRFERLAESPEARSANAKLCSETLRAALGLWRGDALADFTGAVWALPAIARFEAARLDALERCIAAELELGRGRESLRELEQAIRAHPFRERLFALMMLALYREGRQAEALRTFERLRRTLADELGIEPTAELTELQRAILLHDPRLDRAPSTGEIMVPPSARMASSFSVPFVGRPSELKTIATAFKDAVRGEHSTVLIAGEPGIGKTALAARFTRDAVDRGALVLYGHSDPALGIPFQPWNEALTPLVAHAPEELLDAHASVFGAVLARLIPEYAERLTFGSRLGLDIDPQRHRLFGAVADLLARTSAMTPLVIVLDDLHWADRSTVQLLHYLVALDRSLRVLIVATFRDSELRSQLELTDAFAAFARLPAVHHITLSGLRDDEMLELLEITAGLDQHEVGAAFRDALMRETDGNPFFVTELLRHARDGDGIGELWRETSRSANSANSATPRLPLSVHRVIENRIARLGGDTEPILAAGAVIGRDFDLELLRHVTGIDDDSLADVCERSVEAAVLAYADSPASYVFAHALIGHSLYDRLAPVRRAQFHVDVARAIQEIHGAHVNAYTGAIAHHFSEGGTRASARAAEEFAGLAGDYAMTLFASADAVYWYGRALELHDALPDRDDQRRTALLIRLGRAQASAGDRAARATLLQAGTVARRIGAPDLLVAAALATRRGDFDQVAGEDADLTDLTMAALEAVGNAETSERVRLLATLMEHTAGQDWEVARDRATAAVDGARRLGDDHLLMEVITSTYVARAQPDSLTERLDDTAEAVRLADAVGDPLDRFNARFVRYVAVTEAADIDEADRVGGEMEEAAAAAELALPIVQFRIAMTHAGRRILAGDHAGTEAAADQLLTLGATANLADALAAGGGLLAMIRHEQGRLDEMIDGFTAAIEANPDFTVLRAAVAYYYCELARFNEARALLDAERASGFGAIPLDINWTTSLSFFADCAAALDDHDAAAALHVLLVPFATANVYNGLTSRGALSRCLGRINTVLGDHEAAASAFDHAVELNTRLGAPYPLALTRLDYAELLARAAEPDLEGAASLALDAAAAAERYGFADIARRAASWT